ncbi:MAG: hypothetical protein AAF436_18000 [Myxococcota bacterium]
MGRAGWIATALLVVVLGILLWGANEMGVFDTAEELEQRADLVDIETSDDSEEAPAVDKQPKPQDGERSLALSGRASVSLHDFVMNDKQGREVLRVEKMRGAFDVTALRHGVYRMTKATVEGIEVTLYRDSTGQVSLTHALSQAPPPVRQGLHLPPKQKPKDDSPWLLEIGPVDVVNATLTLGFTAKPVQFEVEHARISVRRRAEDAGPMIYIEDVHGIMSKPKPLPNPVGIAYATGLVRLVGEPLVDLTARTCIGRDELRAHAVVPARQAAVTMTIDSQGLMGALGRMGLKIASRRDSEKLHYVHAPVKIEGGPPCGKRGSIEGTADESGVGGGEAGNRREERKEEREERKERKEE